MVFRTETGANVLDGRPELWQDTPPADLLGTAFKQYYGESTWAGPQSVWWSAQEPYPPDTPYRGPWPPDPAWETAPFTVLEQTPSRVVLQSVVSKLTGLQLTRTIVLQTDGALTFHDQAANRGDRNVTRDLWNIHRVPPGDRSFLPLKSEKEDADFSKAAVVKEVVGLTMLEPVTGEKPAKPVVGKMFAVPNQGWMATVVPEGFFTVKFDAIEEAKAAPGQSPVEIYYSSEPQPLCEMEHHSELKTLRPGEVMESSETWRIVPYTESSGAEAQARFLQKLFGP
jgi:hypothetical protein